MNASLWFRVFFLADSVQVRALMCFASCAWGASLLADPEFMRRPYYNEMSAFAAAWMWGVAFLLHAAGALWRILDVTERPRWALVINGWGVAVWGLAILLQIVGAGHWVPSASADVACTIMLFCAFVSSGWNQRTTTA